MALNKDILGQAIYDARNVFNDLTMDQLIENFGSLEGARLAICKAEADAIIKHLTTLGVLTVPGLGMFAGSNVVTGLSNTGKIS